MGGAKDGLAATRAITPSGLPSRVLVLTTYDLDRYVYEALRAGAAGFLLKAAPPDRLAAAIELVAAGESLLAPTVTQRLIAAYVKRPPPSEGIPEPLTELTKREGEVLALIASGLSNTARRHCNAQQASAKRALTCDIVS